MIWYLLWVFRGYALSPPPPQPSTPASSIRSVSRLSRDSTTEPPKLSQDHPIRKAFGSYGTATARHWLFSLLLSVAVAVFLCYPVIFLYESPAASGLPHHVWTSVRSYDGPVDVLPDIEMRQLWVHGSYMKALDTRVLRDALEIQDKLIGPDFADGLSGGVNVTGEAGRDAPSDASQPRAGCCSSDVPETTSWSCHSPLMYWNCSLAALERDEDILATINSQRGRRSSYNFTLQPLSVFAGKSFNGTRLLAADALVITIFDRSGGAVAEEFDRRSRALAREPQETWDYYPATGSTYRNKLYEFRYQPLSINDAGTLISAYSLMLFYVLFSLRKLKAVKSVFGLFCTVIAQMFISICSSFTVCGILRINLANVPGEAYPFVVLVIGLENMFRLINAVLESPAHMPTVTRIANALGDVGHLALAAAAQNLFILWLLSRVVSPSVAPACAFAAVALVFDFVFHLTFFVAVLSVDVRRMELQDSLDRINLATQRRSSATSKLERRTWGGALLQGRLPFSTRIAGTIAMVSFILTLNWHFFDHDRRPFSFVNILRLLQIRSPRNIEDELTPPPINQARTPEAWLKMQDYISAKELIDFVKPGSHSFVARVYEPLTAVLKGADRTAANGQMPSVFVAIRDLAEQHFFPFALAIVFAIAAVTLLMNYLLWNELPEEDAESGLGDDAPLSVRSLPKSHDLDIVKIATCSQGHIVSISLDRLTSIWFLDHRTHTYSHVILQTSALHPPLWPIVAAAIDDTGHWVAILTDSGRVALWSLAERRFVKSRVLDMRSQAPSVFAFAFHQMDEVERLSLLVVTPDSRLMELDFRTGHLWTHQIAEVPLASAALSYCIKGQPKIVSVSKDGVVHLSFPSSGEWTTETLDAVEDWHHPDPMHSKVKYAYPIPTLCMLAAVRSCQVDLIDIPTRALVHTFQTGQIKGHTLRVLHSKRRICGCHSPTVPDFSIVYTDSETQNCIMHTYAPGNGSANGLICLRPPALVEDEHITCSGFENATEALHWVKTPGSWEAACIPSVVGIRKRPSSDSPPVKSTSSDISYFPGTPASSNPFQNGTLKHRDQSTVVSRHQPNGMSANGYHRAPAGSPNSQSSESEEWEAWTLSASGELHTTPLLPRPRSDSLSEDYMEEDVVEEEQLFVSKPGPIVKVGKKSVAVGFGNALKIISLGSERFEEESTNTVVDSATLSLSWRKKAQGKKAGEREKERERLERMERDRQQQPPPQHQHQHQHQQPQHQHHYQHLAVE